MDREKIRSMMIKLESMMEDYENFETALVLALRESVFTLDNDITDKQLAELQMSITEYEGSLLNEDIHYILDELIEE